MTTVWFGLLRLKLVTPLGSPTMNIEHFMLPSQERGTICISYNPVTSIGTRYEKR